MEYRSGSGHYILSYHELKDDYVRFCRMSDKTFMKNIISALHFACITGYLKELGNESLSDEGIVHELVHLLPGSSGTTTSLRDVRKLFRRTLKLT